MIERVKVFRREVFVNLFEAEREREGKESFKAVGFEEIIFFLSDRRKKRDFKILNKINKKLTKKRLQLGWTGKER